MNKFSQIDISIDGVAYHDASGRHVGSNTWRESIIIINRDEGGIPHIESIPVDSTVDVQDIGLPGTFSGDYQYLGGNDRQYIFRRSNQTI